MSLHPVPHTPGSWRTGHVGNVEALSSERTKSELRLGRRERMSILAFWLALGLLESGKTYVNSRANGVSADWPSVLSATMPWWLMWAALTPVAIALARRFRLDRGSSIPIGIHIVAALTLAIAHHLIVGTLYYLTETRGGVYLVGDRFQLITLSAQIRLWLGSYFMLNVLTYLAIVGGYHALEYYKRYREGELRGARLEASMHRARLDALRMELNPHFLFNTLNAISGLVRRRENDDAVLMLARLGELLRSTLEDGAEQEVPLEREVELLRIYLDIVRLRFHDRLQVAVDIADEAREGLVPTLILQPLVENAVRHGVGRLEESGRITVGARRVGERLELFVEDNGAGFAEPAGSPGCGANGGVTGIGLANTRERLAQLYERRGDLRCESVPGGGARVVVVLPYRTQREVQGVRG